MIKSMQNKKKKKNKKQKTKTKRRELEKSNIIGKRQHCKTPKLDH